ncbi:MAG: DNA-formamidopyrimidine glycosylase family protein, partial [Rhodanobacter sp.]
MPEVETTRRGIAPALKGRRIVDVMVRDRRLRWPIAANLEAAIRHRTVRSVERRAKY